MANYRKGNLVEAGLDKRRKSDKLIVPERELSLQNKEKEIRKEELIIAKRDVELRVHKRMSALRDSEERMNFFIDNVSDYAIIFFDINGNITTWNSGAQRIKLYESHEIIGKNFSIFFTESDQQNNIPQLLLSKAKSDGHVEDEGWRVKKDGTLFWEAVTIISLRKNDGTHYGYVKIAHDLTERKRAQEEINNLNSTLEEKIERTERQATEILIANKELVFQNNEKEKRAAELVLANKELAFQSEEKEKRAAELVIANKELAFQNEEKENRATELIIANKELAFQNEEKEKRAAELVIANKELAYQNEEKEKRASELFIANNELALQYKELLKREAENKELETFSYSVSHDLRAPLRHIGGFVDLLNKNNSSQLDETGLRYLSIISESSHAMGNLIDALLTFSRLSRAELLRTKINSKNMISQVLKEFKDELADRNIELNLSELPDAMGDVNLIRQVWVNLISNAIKYSRNKEKAVIDIGGKIENDKTIFYIKDNGAGFDMRYVDKLFGVFHRLHKVRDFEGIGIGLANVNRIVMRHGGKCWAEGEVDKGATFFFSILNN